VELSLLFSQLSTEALFGKPNKIAYSLELLACLVTIFKK
jgi:hypothetical protein